VEAYRITGKKKYLEDAKRAGNWWTGLEIKGHGKLDGMLRAIHGNGIDRIVFSTVSDGSNGIFELWRETREDRYAAVATRAGEWMLNNMYLPIEGMFYDMVDPASGEVEKTFSLFWPERKNQVLNDVARPNNEGYLFRDMYEFTHNEKYKKVFLRLCESLVEKQGPEGLWMDFTPNDKETGMFHPRFNLWYAESLIRGFEMTGDKRYLEAARRTLAFYTRFQKKNGTIYYENFLNGTTNDNSPSGSTVAFAGLLWIQLLKHGAGEEFRDNVEKSFAWIMENRFSPDHPDRNVARAVNNLRSRNKGGKTWFVQRDVGTSFGLRFLAEYYRFRFGGEVR
jgi:rhamnogalacturonyl hydrolase YesR